jgi:hypothetical protein
MRFTRGSSKLEVQSSKPKRGKPGTVMLGSAPVAVEVSAEAVEVLSFEL